jgi:plastocyanin
MKSLGVFVFIFFLAQVNSATLFAGTVRGKVKTPGARKDANAVIYVADIPGKKFSPPSKHAIVDQKNLVFVPHILPVLAGTTVDFHNSDDVLHNVFSPDACAGSFDLGTWGKGEVRSHTFLKPDCFAVILCNVHPEMEAYIVVLQNPYFVVSSADGSYEIKDVPAGKYVLKIWHEDLKGTPVQVDVPKKGTVTADFDLRK